MGFDDWTIDNEPRDDDYTLHPQGCKCDDVWRHPLLADEFFEVMRQTCNTIRYFEPTGDAVDEFLKMITGIVCEKIGHRWDKDHPNLCALCMLENDGDPCTCPACLPAFVKSKQFDKLELLDLPLDYYGLCTDCQDTHHHHD